MTDTITDRPDTDRQLAAKVTRLDDIRPAQLQAWASACYHLFSCGLTPLPPSHVVAALRRRGWWSQQ